MSRVPLTAGALVRRALRRYLDAIGVTYVEERGLLDSQFILVDPTDEQLRTVANVARRLNT